MRNFSIEENLNKTILKLKKKDRVTYDAIMKKIWEVTNSPDIEHYKNLRNPLQQFKRIHINGPFVLVFRYNKAEDQIRFYDFDHHDNMYGKPLTQV